MIKRRSRRPSLIGTAARTAVIAGTATAVSTSVSQSKHQAAQQQAAQQQAQVDAAVQQAMAAQPLEQQPQEVATPAPAAISMEEKIAQLQKLAELHQSGVLSDEEFAALKSKLMAG